MTDLRIPSVSVRWRLLAMVLVVPKFVDGPAEPRDGDRVSRVGRPVISCHCTITHREEADTGRTGGYRADSVRSRHDSGTLAHCGSDRCETVALLPRSHEQRPAR